MSRVTSSGSVSRADAPTWLDPLVRTSSVLLSVGLVIQGFLGGSGFFEGKPGLVTAHEMIGNLAFLVAIGQVVAVFLGLQKGLFSRALLIVSIALLGLVVAQLGLGYSGRDNATIMAWHLANGVLLMGACTLSAALAFLNPRT
jgi:hypothetical protein